jgi:hypothetical protein
MNDPYTSIEFFNMGIEVERPLGSHNPNLTHELTIDLLKLSNDYAFERFKNDYITEMTMNPMLGPILLTTISHDWIFVNHGYSEDEFKLALFEHRIHEDE